LNAVHNMKLDVEHDVEHDVEEEEGFYKFLPANTAYCIDSF